MTSIAFDRIQKQDLLLMGISCHKINPQAFLDYIKTIKQGNYDNLDAWQVQELQQAIESFNNSPTMQLIINPEIDHQISTIEEEKKDSHSNFNTMKKEKMSFFVHIEDKFFKAIYPAKQVTQFNLIQQPPKNPIVNYYLDNPFQTIEVTIPQTKIVQQGFLEKKYSQFQIVINEFNWSVWRRYKQFEKLRLVLENEFPEALIPPLPRKKLTNKFTSPFLIKRTHMLELFLSTILNSPQLRCSEYLVQFLSADDQKFEELDSKIKIQKEQGDGNKINDLTQLTSIDGQTVIQINPFLSKYFYGLSSYLEQTNEIYRSVRSNSKGLFNSLDEATKYMGNLKGNLSQIRNITDDFNSSHVIGNLGILSYTFNLLEQYLSNWEKNLNDLKSTYKKEMQEQCFESIKVRNAYEFRYLKSEEELKKKKEKLYFDFPTEKWGIQGEYDVAEVRRNKKLAFELMLPQETRETLLLQEQFGFVNKQLFDQLIQYFDNKSFIYTKRFMEMIKLKQQGMILFLENLDEIACQLGELIKMRNGVSHDQLKIKEEYLKQFMDLVSVKHVIASNHRKKKKDL